MGRLSKGSFKPYRIMLTTQVDAPAPTQRRKERRRETWGGVGEAARAGGRAGEGRC